ncbi:MAG: 3'-5' exonuclease [Mariprofundaceae bacterium]
MPRDTLVFDIETVPDADASRRILHQPSLTDSEARDALSCYFLEKTEGRNDFPRQPFHQVLSISYAHLISEPGENGQELILRRISSGGNESSSEQELITGFFNIIAQRAPRLVSYNGRGFDIPVLKYRAMVHGITAPRWFKEGDRYHSYDSRYSHKYHLDLLEVLSDHGASARCSLDEIAACFCIPGKLDTAGSDVRSLFEAGEIEAIRNYCETDVCSTLLLFLRWQYFCGELSMASYKRAILGLHHYLESESEMRTHLGDFLTAWNIDTD